MEISQNPFSRRLGAHTMDQGIIKSGRLPAIPDVTIYGDKNASGGSSQREKSKIYHF